MYCILQAAKLPKSVPDRFFPMRALEAVILAAQNHGADAIVDLSIHLERVMGIEPTFSAWEADVLPLNYTRAFFTK
jgi:hypothetical protein